MPRKKATKKGSKDATNKDSKEATKKGSKDATKDSKDATKDSKDATKDSKDATSKDATNKDSKDATSEDNTASTPSKAPKDNTPTNKKQKKTISIEPITPLDYNGLFRYVPQPVYEWDKTEPGTTKLFIWSTFQYGNKILGIRKLWAWLYLVEQTGANEFYAHDLRGTLVIRVNKSRENASKLFPCIISKTYNGCVYEYTGCISKNTLDRIKYSSSDSIIIVKDNSIYHESKVLRYSKYITRLVDHDKTVPTWSITDGF